MKKTWKKLLLIGIMLVSFIGFSATTFAADDDKLLYDLVYDKDRNVLTGKTTPNANIFLTNLAGSIVANDKGEFEVPIPKDTKEAMIGMLDAEGDKSTEVRYNFEEGKIIATAESNAETEKESGETKESTQDSKTADTTTNETTQNSSQSTKNSEETTATTEKDSKKESSNVEKEGTSKWVWIIVAIVVIAIAGIGWFVWQKQQKNKKAKKGKGKGKKKATGKSKSGKGSGTKKRKKRKK